MAIIRDNGEPVRPYRFSEAAKDAACRAMAQSGSRAHAADAAGVCVNTIRRYILQDPDFRDRIEHAKAQYVRTLECEAHRRAVDGVDEARMGSSGSLYFVKKYSDALLLHLLKRKAPDEHGDQITVDQNTTVVGELGLSKLSSQSREQLRQILEREIDALEQIEGTETDVS